MSPGTIGTPGGHPAGGFVFRPTTFLLTSFHREKPIRFGMGPKKGPDGNLHIAMPMGDRKLPGIAADDIGKCALAMFRKGREFLDKTVGVAGDHLTGNQMAAALAKALGVEIRYNDASPQACRGFGFPGADDLGTRSGPESRRTRDGSRSGRMQRGFRGGSETVPADSMAPG